MPASHNIRQVWEFMTRHGKSFDTVVKKASILIKMHDMNSEIHNELMLPLSLVTVTKCFGWISLSSRIFYLLFLISRDKTS